MKFDVVEPNVTELSEGEPQSVVLENALLKARKVARGHPGALVIGADTEVAIDGGVLGQPADREHALEMLRLLVGRTHEVLGGLAVISPEGERSAVARTSVSFALADEALLEAYLDFGEWPGRAGGYAIQGLGSALVERVDGDLANVIGLPVSLLLEMTPLDGIDRPLRES